MGNFSKQFFSLVALLLLGHSVFAATVTDIPCTGFSNFQSQPYGGSPLDGTASVNARWMGDLTTQSDAYFYPYTGTSSVPDQNRALYYNAGPNESSAVQITCPGYPTIGSFINTWAAYINASNGGPNVTNEYVYSPSDRPNLGNLFRQNPGQMLAQQFYAKVPFAQVGLGNPQCELSMGMTLHRIDPATGTSIEAFELLINVFESNQTQLNYHPDGMSSRAFFSGPLTDSYPQYFSPDIYSAQQTGTLWDDLRFFRVKFSAQQLMNILTRMGAPDQNLDYYNISAFGSLHEVPNHSDGINEMSCGATVAAQGLFMLP